MPLGDGRIAQPAQGDEAGEELRLAPRLARLRDAVPGGDGVGGAEIARAQQAPGEHLPLAPEGPRGVGRRARSGVPGRRRFGVAVAPAEPAGALEGEAGIDARRLGAGRRVGVRPVGGVVEPRGGDALPRRVQVGHGARRRAGLPRQGKPVEAAPVLVRAEMRAVPVEEAGLDQRIRGRLRPAGAQHVGGLALLAGAGQRLGQAPVALQGARRAGGEPLEGERVLGVARQRLLRAAGERVLGGPVRVGQAEGGDLGGGGPGAAGLQPHPRHHLADEGVRALRRDLRLRPSPGPGMRHGHAPGGAHRVGGGRQPGGRLRKGRRRGRGEQANRQAKNGTAAHPQVLSEAEAAVCPALRWTGQARRDRSSPSSRNCGTKRLGWSANLRAAAFVRTATGRVSRFARSPNCKAGGT